MRTSAFHEGLWSDSGELNTVVMFYVHFLNLL